MRETLLIIAFLFTSIPTFTFAQSTLSESQRSSSEIFIYKMNKKDVRNLYLKGRNLEESMLHTFVMSCAKIDDIPTLPKGNYIQVRVVDNKLEYSDYTVDNFYHSTIKGENVRLLLSDTLGNVIDNAVVKRGIKRLKFDKTTQTYHTRRIGDEKIVQVNNSGVWHYIAFEKEYYDYWNSFFWETWYTIKRGFKSIFTPKRMYYGNEYDGFVVFSKPKYKPGETLKFKAYLTRNDKPYKKEVDVALISHYPTRIDTTLTTLRPYRPGMYAWEFPLSDSLNLRLDKNYNIVLRTKEKRTHYKEANLRGSFSYEEYELGRITFDAKADRQKYIKGDSVKLQFNAQDENGMPIYDGQINITVRLAKYYKPKYYSDHAFIPDEIWKHSFDISGKKELVLPDSIFVENTAMEYDIECSFLDSANEVHVENIVVSMDMHRQFIDFSTNQGILTIKELANGESMPTRALLTAYNPEANIVYRESVTLPYSLPLFWNVDSYKVATATSSGNFYVGNIKDDIIKYRFFRNDGSIRLVVDNPAKFPFWYTIRKNNKTIDKGYGTALDYSYKDKGKNGYSMQLSYLLGKNTQTISGRLPYVEKNLSMKVNTATTVYPGQTTTIDVLVKDKKGRPVNNVDITAYAFTSKFGSYSPNVTIFGKTVSGKQFKKRLYDTYKESPYHAKSPMEWDTWRKRMGLDSIEYYKFLYPEIYYSYTEKDLGNMTQIAPYVVIDGNLQGVHILWIDEQPHYFHQAQQVNVYSFPITPGYHTLKFRTYDREIIAENIYVEKGTKTTVSINGKKSAVHTYPPKGKDDRQLLITVNESVKNSIGSLSEREIALLTEHMITINDTFGTACLSNDRPMEIAGRINAGGVNYLLKSPVIQPYNYRTGAVVARPILVGPFPYRGFATNGKNIGALYADMLLVNNFSIEGGYQYEIWKNYVKQTSWRKVPFSSEIKSFTPVVSFTESAFTVEQIKKKFNDKLLEIVREERGFFTSTAKENGLCRLRLEIGNYVDTKTEAKPLLICLSHENRKDSNEYIYYGSTRDFTKLPQGNYKVNLIFSDITQSTTSVTLRENGLNYLKIDSIKPVATDSVSRGIFDLLRSQLQTSIPVNPLLSTPHMRQDNIIIAPSETIDYVNSANYNGEVLTGTVHDQSGEPIVGATLLFIGTTNGVITDERGRFTLPNMGSGGITISFVGYVDRTMQLTPGHDYKIKLEEMSADLYLQDAVVAYGLTGRGVASHADVIYEDSEGPQALQGRVSGVTIGGRSSGRNVVIDTETLDMTQPEGWRSAGSLRANFHDDAFWRPNLSTDKNGSVSFEVTYPDDITNWNANFIANGGRKKTDKAQLNIKSFKPLNAQLSTPQFAMPGDSLNLIGRLTNHLGDTVNIKRSIELQGITSERNISLPSSHVDYIPTIVSEPDSVSITYSLTMEDGYLDGERRTIPVYKPGILESRGEFAVLNDTSICQYQTSPMMGKVTVHAEASAMQLFFDEIDNIDLFPYFSNEQMASKIKALLLKKRLCSQLGMTFGENKKIENLIKLLEKNMHSDNLWGWWNQDKTEVWVSKQVIEALSDAQASGYSVRINKQAVSDALIRELNQRLATDNKSTHTYFAKHDLLNLLDLLKKFDAKIDYGQYFSFVSSLPNTTMNDKLRCMEIGLSLGIIDKPQIDSLLNLASETMMGSMYWGEEEKPNTPRHFWLPYSNNTENTLTAYRILRKTEGNEKELEKIRHYFFEIRKGGSWYNSYESSRIMETILPDMLTPESGFSNTALTINGKSIDKLPMTAEFEAGEQIDVKKTGTEPLFFTVYQQTWNNAPDSVSEGFSIKTSFGKNGDTTSVLEAGKSVDLNVNVTVDSDAEYVVIEVPIPAGCSYEPKGKGYFGTETHREYYKEKAVIFCNRLTKGTHPFIIKLIPRYTGIYHLNPAKVELMYYPTFFGRGNMEICEIR